jgi:hypothetical protein
MKTAMILTAFAALAISGNAMAIDTTPPGTARPIEIGNQSAGDMVFVPVATVNLPPSAAAPYGACRYTATWNFPSAATPVLTALCQLREAKRPGNLSCSANREVDFTTFVNTVGLTCNGFDPSGALSPMILVLSEFATGLDGTVVVDGLGADFITID